MRRRARLASWEDNATHGPRLRPHLDPGTLRLSRSSWRRPVAHPAAARRYAVRSGDAGTRPAAPAHGCGPNPRILTGWFGASSHGLRFPPAGFPPVSRLPARALPLRPPCSGFPSPGVLRFRPFGRCCPVRFPSVSLRVPFPLSNLHVSAAARRICGRGSRAGATKVTSSRRAPWLRSPRSARSADVPRGADRVARRGGPPHHRLHLGSRDDPGSWRPELGSFQRRPRPGP